MRIRQYTLTGGGAAATASYAALQASTVNVPFTLTGAAAVISPGREVTLTSAAADLSGILYTVVGKDTFGGNAITEVITGPGAGLTVKGLKIFSSITSVTPNTTNAGTMSVGNPARVCGNWINANLHTTQDNPPTIRCSTQIVSGAPAGAWEFTNEDVVNISGSGAFVDGTVTSTPAAGGDTASVFGMYARYVVTSAAGSLKARFVAPSF
jgi:hypothetical protein